MVIMVQRQEATLARNLAIQRIIEIVLRVHDFRLGVVVPVQSVQVGLDSVVSQVGQTGLAGGVAGEERWTHVGWEEAEDVVDSTLVVVHFLVKGGEVEGGEVFVRPGVGCDLVAFTVHTLVGMLVRVGFENMEVRAYLDQRRITGRALVNLLVTIVVAIDEESGLCVISSQEIKQLVGPCCWSIVKGESDHTLLGAAADLSPVWHVADLGSWNITQSWSWWDNGLTLLQVRGECFLGEWVSVPQMSDGLGSVCLWVSISGMVGTSQDRRDEGQNLEQVETHDGDLR